MDNSFKNDEKLYRAVYPPNISSMYWKSDGSVSSAAFADPNGLSVERGYYRKDEDVVSAMQMRFTGSIIRVYVKNCRDIGAEVRYLPSNNSPYHSEIHGSATTLLLSKTQRRYLAEKASIIKL